MTISGWKAKPRNRGEDFPTIDFTTFLRFIWKLAQFPPRWLRLPFSSVWCVCVCQNPAFCDRHRRAQQATKPALTLLSKTSHLPWPGLAHKGHYSRTWLDRKQSAGPKDELVATTPIVHTALQSLTITPRKGCRRWVRKALCPFMSRLS